MGRVCKGDDGLWDIDVGVLKEAKAKLHLQNGADRSVDLGGSELACLEGGGKSCGEGGVIDGHLHVDSGVESTVCGIVSVLGEAMGLQALDGVGVGDDKAFEAPLVSEDIGEEPVVASGGHIIEVHVGRHDGCCTGVDGGVEWFQIDVLELGIGDVGGVVIAASLGSTVSGEVLDGGEDMVGSADVVALKAANLSGGKGRAEVGVFACTFDDASPTGIAGDINHGTEGPVDANGAGFPGGDGLGTGGEGRIPGGGHGKGHGEDGAEAMNDVKSEEERDVKAGVLHGEMLEAVDLVGIGDEEERADVACLDACFDRLRGAKEEELIELSELLLHSHLMEEGLDTLVDGGVR